MAALLEPTEKSSCFSSLQLAKLFHGSSEGSPAAFAGDGPSDFEAFDFMQIDKSQLFDGSWLTEVTSGDLYEHEKEHEEVKRKKVEAGCRIGFRTKSEVEILDDGFKWRKYGKKAVKNSPNPRHAF